MVQESWIALRDVDGLEPAEVCTLLDLSPGAVRRDLEVYFGDPAQNEVAQ